MNAFTPKICLNDFSVIILDSRGKDGLKENKGVVGNTDIYGKSEEILKICISKRGVIERNEYLDAVRTRKL